MIKDDGKDESLMKRICFTAKRFSCFALWVSRLQGLGAGSHGQKRGLPDCAGDFCLQLFAFQPHTFRIVKNEPISEDRLFGAPLPVPKYVSPNHKEGRMKFRILIFIATMCFIAAGAAYEANAQRGGLSDSKIVAGLKEALEVGTGNAVNLTGRVDGFFKNAAIKILLPKQIEPVGKGLRAIGQGRMVDEFVMSMNRAAEKAAPEARKIFVAAIREMTFDDARKILFGGNTSATEYFKEKTSDRIAGAFRPIIEKSMNEVGATRQYKDLMGRFEMIPFARADKLDIDEYVVGKSLDGLFYMVGEEEKKIRKNPAARVSDILKVVFGRR
jgi:hypothetical protein